MVQTSAVLLRYIFFEFQEFDNPARNGNCKGAGNNLISGGI